MPSQKVEICTLSNGPDIWRGNISSYRGVIAGVDSLSLFRSRYNGPQALSIGQTLLDIPSSLLVRSKLWLLLQVNYKNTFDRSHRLSKPQVPTRWLKLHPSHSFPLREIPRATIDSWCILLICSPRIPGSLRLPGYLSVPLHSWGGKYDPVNGVSQTV